MNPYDRGSRERRLFVLFGTASLLAIAGAQQALAQQMPPATVRVDEAPPETVLITGSLIRGAAAVGVPVVNLRTADFAESGALTTAELFRTVPAANVSPGPVATEGGANLERATRINIRQLDNTVATRSLLMIDGVRFPGQGDNLCAIDPSIIPAISLERIDILVDGASATYGADAVGGVINVILKRNFDGAITQFRFGAGNAGKTRYAASQLWGRTWDGGDITLGYEWYDDRHSNGNFASNFTTDYTPWGLDNRIPLASSLPGTISTGAPAASPTNVYSATQGANCINCWAIPKGTGFNWSPGSGGFGPTAPGSAPTLAWNTGQNGITAIFNTPANSGTNGTANEFNPYLLGYGDADNTRNGATLTVDQRLTKDVSFFGTGFYSNRRAHFVNPSSINPAQNNDLSIAVPTLNPYYPVGGAPSGLRVNYNIGLENPSTSSAYEVAGRYELGFNIELPGDWEGQVFYAHTYDSNSATVTNTVNRNAVSAALGWTIAAVAASGTGPSLGTWTKPPAVPYLNLFCDPQVYKCNAPATLNYISGLILRREIAKIDTKAAKFDGPVAELPAGDLKAAIALQYESTNISLADLNTTGSPTLLAPLNNASINRNVWAAFVQLNVPVFSEKNAILFFDKLDIEAGWRHDQYSDFGGTSNPKVAFNWTPSSDVGLILKGSWGTSFRAPSFSETNPLGGTIACQNPNTSTGTSINGSCAGSLIQMGTPTAVVGSGAWKVSTLNGGLFGAGGVPFGVSASGGEGASVAAGLRTNTINAGTSILRPETSTNYSLGVEFAPSKYLKGLDIQATWYRLKISNVLASFGSPNTSTFNTPEYGGFYLVPSDFGCPLTANSAPQTCAPFENAVASLLTGPRSAVPASFATQVYWINDGGVFNKGSLAISGIDFTGSYDWEMDNIGAFNVGVSGTYYLYNKQKLFPGSPAIDTLYSVTINNSNTTEVGVESRPRLKYRARFGWADDGWSVTAFVNFQTHFFNLQTAPLNVNNQCIATGSSTPGGTFPCAITGYRNIVPTFHTFDLSIGYDTGDLPANDYLKHVGIQFVAQNILDKHAPFAYKTNTAPGNPAAFDILENDMGRTISVIITKTW